jgi:transcription antitermination factor NusG
MPVLPLEPFVYPENLLGSDGQIFTDPGEWWVLQTKPRVEKSLARRLLRESVPFFLPLFERSHRLKSRVITAHLPLFPGYLFLRGDAEARLTALETNFVARCLPVADEARLQADLTRVFQMMGADAPLRPEPRLFPGARVEITDGPLAGMTGTVLRRGKQLRFFVEVRMLQCGVSVELERWMFQPVN